MTCLCKALCKMSEGLGFFLWWLTCSPGQYWHWRVPPLHQGMSFTILYSRCIIPCNTIVSPSLWQSSRYPLESSVNIIHRNRYQVLHLYVRAPVPHRFEGQLQWGLCTPCPGELGNGQYPLEDVYTCGFLSESLGQCLWNGSLPSIIDTFHSHSPAHNKLSRHIVYTVSSLPPEVAEPSRVGWHMCCLDGTKPHRSGTTFHQHKNVPKNTHSVQYTCKSILDYERI